MSAARPGQRERVRRALAEATNHQASAIGSLAQAGAAHAAQTEFHARVLTGSFWDRLRWLVKGYTAFTVNE
jgi:hypothetical protein